MEKKSLLGSANGTDHNQKAQAVLQKLDTFNGDGEDGEDPDEEAAEEEERGKFSRFMVYCVVGY